METSASKPSKELLAKAMDLLARRDHSVTELQRKLQKRAYENESIDSVLEILKKEGFLCDQRFAENYINMRLRKGFGPIRIAAELHERGIDDLIVEEKFGDVDQNEWVQRIVEIKNKKFSKKSMDGSFAWGEAIDEHAIDENANDENELDEDYRQEQHNNYKEQIKQKRFFAQRGFSHEQIHRAFNLVIEND